MSDLILSVRVEIRYDAEVVDLPGLIRKYHDEYLAVDMSRGHAPWERPAVFVDECIRELVSVGFGPEDRPYILDKSWHDDPEVDFRWTEEQWESLLAVCPEADPDYEPSAYDAARKPGPNDVPLLLDVAGEAS